MSHTAPSRTRVVALMASSLAAVCVAASGCTVANSGHGGYDPNTLRVVLSQEPPTLEPCESSLTSTGIVVRSNITEPLIERDPNSGDLQPLLATGWRQTSPTEWTFDIRDGMTFSDGAPFTAAGRGVLHRPGRQLRPAVQRRRICVRRREAEAVGPRRQHRSMVGTEKPDPILPLRISFVEIVPQTTSTTEKVREPIGTGPVHHRELGVRPEAGTAPQRHLLGRQAGIRPRRIPVAQRGQRPRGDDHQRRNRYRHFARTRRRRRRSGRAVPEQRDHRAADASNRAAAERYAGTPGGQLRGEPHRNRQGVVPRAG